MASAGGEASLPATSRGVDNYHHISDTESETSQGERVSLESPCPYRTSRFFDGECTQYFDCPTHILEREEPIDHDDEYDERPESEDREAGPSSRPEQVHTEASRPESHREQRWQMDGNGERVAANRDRRRDGVVLDLPDSDNNVPDAARNNGAVQGGSSAQPRELGSPAGGPRPEFGLTLREALDETREASRGSATDDPPRQITHIAATPLNRGSVVNPMAPAFNPRTERRPPLDFTLPRWQPDAENAGPDFTESSSSSSTSASRAPETNRPLPPPPQIAEEDECPICHYELPSRDLPDFEARRETHINECIVQHSTYSPGGASRDRPPGAHGTPPPRTMRRTGIFPYIATEKDCVDDAECTICLEEFQVGVPMARLECLCRFHRSCIQACAGLVGGDFWFPSNSEGDLSRS
ncbi:hypothetical protein DL764_009782 [Monosporascus ibericus]|uniref:RING-type E3 ubiquitin transferase n=1 Tax=Monosporascus ibericus TaxID=155417 RepID=A0A4Q4SWX3_9PEZI|nr:hypothetical protein DL764_009782 [Monosporascus ibericus]